MNKLEGRYYLWLRRRQDRGEIESFEFEGITVKLADGARYTPDFFVELATGELECHEVKGFWREAARVRIKVAAGKYPFRFIAVQEDRQRGWVYENFTDSVDLEAV
jgi:hypothetical protein